MRGMGVFIPHLYHNKCFSTSVHLYIQKVFTIWNMKAKTVVKLIVFWCPRPLFWLFCILGVLYIEKLKESGYWFILCLHKIPFTFKMLLPGRQSHSDCAQTKRKFSADEHNKQHVGRTCYSEDKYRCPVDNNNSVRFNFSEGKWKSWQINSLMTSVKWLIHYRKVELCKSCY